MCDIDFNRLLTYDPDTGHLFWKERLHEDFPEAKRLNSWNSKWSGKRAFTFLDTTVGYYRGSVLGKSYLAHRVIWHMKNGRWPKDMIDHIDGNGANNRIDNLREVSSSENSRNMKLHATNTTGFHGVSQRENGKWVARIDVNRKTVYLGSFDTFEEAVKCRREGEIKYEYHENHGRIK
jgi:hypothetical protein